MKTFPEYTKIEIGPKVAPWRQRIEFMTSEPMAREAIEKELAKLKKPASNKSGKVIHRAIAVHQRVITTIEVLQIIQKP